MTERIKVALLVYGEDGDRWSSAELTCRRVAGTDDGDPNVRDGILLEHIADDKEVFDIGAIALSRESAQRLVDRLTALLAEPRLGLVPG